MLKVVPATVLLLLAAMPTSAYAADCEGQKGKVIFEDDFADDSGGWGAARGASWDASFGKSGLTLRLQTPSTTWPVLNNTFAANEGDFCVEAVLPKAVAADNNVRTSLTFLANDANSYYALMIGSDNAMNLWRREGGNWVKLYDLSDPRIKLEAGSVVALRVVVKANLLTASVNNVELKKVRLQIPGGNLKFGLYVQSDKEAPAPGATFQFKRYKVTAGE
jgi:hypothetical protein